jgi:hypothetical protein
MKKKNELLHHIPYSIVSLYSKRDPIEVISVLRKWIHQGNRDTRAFLVVFILDHGGIFDELEKFEVVYLSDDYIEDEKFTFSNILLNSLTLTENAVEKFIAFIKDLYEKCCSEFRAAAQPVLRSLLFNKHLRKWVVDNLTNSRVNKTLQKMIIELYNSGNDSLQGTLFNAMNQWSVHKWNKKGEWKDEWKKRRDERKQAKLDDFVNEVTRQLQN